MNTIKIWEERQAEYLKKYPKATVSIEMFMKDELDDYRKAARATPAQPVPTFEVTEIHGTCRVNPYGDKPHVTGYHERTYTIPAQPASTVAEAIRKLPLPDTVVMAGCHGDIEVYTPDQMRALLSEAAALAEQVQGHRPPPTELQVVHALRKAMNNVKIPDEFRSALIGYFGNEWRALTAQDGQKSEGV